MARVTVEDCLDKVPNRFALVVLAAVCVAAFVAVRFVGRFLATGKVRGAHLLDVVARVPLEPRRSLYVVEVAGKTLLVGTSEMGLSVLAPTVREPWNTPVEDGPLQSGVTIYDEHPMPMPAETNVPPLEDNGTHSGVNRNGAVLRQVEQFLLFDQIVPTCMQGDEIVACDCNPDGGGVCD